jgi:SEC-C motif-containing protein
MSIEFCPCGSEVSYADCCAPLITGALQADTPERLMRSRYSAYVKAEIDYLYETTHPDHRKGYDSEGTRKWAEGSQWLGLEIVSSRGGKEDSLGEVEFIARFSEDGTETAHHELGKFKRHEGRWYFTDGKMVGAKPLISNKIGRNEPCPCGSGAKYKKCCGK